MKNKKGGSTSPPIRPSSHKLIIREVSADVLTLSTKGGTPYRNSRLMAAHYIQRSRKLKVFVDAGKVAKPGGGSAFELA